MAPGSDGVLPRADDAHPLLLVDNDAARAAVICTRLQAGGRAVLALRFPAAWAALVQGTWSALLLDAGSEDGRSLCVALRRHPVAGGLPVLHLGDEALSTAAHIAALEAGVDAFLRPADAAELLAPTLEALARARQRGAGAQTPTGGVDAATERFVSALTHELRNPLNAIVMSAHVLAARAQGSDLQTLVAAIQRNADLQASLLADLQDAARIHAGAVVLHRERCDTAVLLRALLAAMAPKFAQRGIQVQVEAEGGMPPVWLDPGRFEQILRNLLDNARKFSEQGGTVLVRLRQADGMLDLQVRDQGRGMSAAFLARAFEAFAQREVPGQRTQGGLGLGLSVVDRLARLHGGRAEVESVGAGQGVTVRVRLPLQRPVARV